MMKIDFHTHIFPDKIAQKTVAVLGKHAHVEANTDGSKQGLLDSMTAGNVDLSIILPVVTNPSQFDSINQFALSINEEHAGEKIPRLISFGGIHPEDEDYKEKLKQIRQQGMKGIKLHPDYQKVYIDDIANKRVIAYAQELGLITVIHAGIDIGLPENVYATPSRIRNLVDEVRPDTLVLAHYGGFEMWDGVEEYLVGENVFLDTAYTLGFISEQQFMRIFKNHGVDKILFATDSPWQEQKEVVEALESLPFTEQEKEKIFWQNAANLLGLQI